MAIIEKNEIDLDTTLVQVRFLLKGNRQEIIIHTTASECCDFIDILNENKFKTLSKSQKQMMENRFYTFNDYMKKESITIAFDSIKAFTMPFFIDNGNTYDMKVLHYKY